MTPIYRQALANPQSLARAFAGGQLARPEAGPVVGMLLDCFVASGRSPEGLSRLLAGYSGNPSQGAAVARAIEEHAGFVAGVLPVVEFHLFGEDSLTRAEAGVRATGMGLPLAEIDHQVVYPERYHLKLAIGQGGYATVYEAVDQVSRQVVAIKALDPSLAVSDNLLRAFQREINILRRIDHPKIVRLLGWGDDIREESRIPLHLDVRSGPYFVMEYVGDLSLQDWVTNYGCMSWQRAQPILIEILEALSAVHALGVVHRDLKPSNLFLRSATGGIKLFDFGIALDRNDAEQVRDDRLRTIGSPPFMAPEQIRGEIVDHHADLYALGVVAYYLLTGREPFSDPIVTAVLHGHLSGFPPPFREVRPDLSIPDGVEEIVLKALSKDPANRYQTASEMAEAIRQAPS